MSIKEKNYSRDMYVSDTVIAGITGIAAQTLRNDRHHGRGIPYSKIGRSCRYLIGDALDFMEARKIQTIGDAR